MNSVPGGIATPEISPQVISPFQHPSRAASIWQLCNTLIPFALLWVAAWYALSLSFWLALPITLLGSGFLIRTFIIFHDCGHQSFFRSKRANAFWGTITGILTFTPYHHWHANHARHHATSGNLDKRGQGDVWMMTVEEYLAASPKEKLQYRLYRHPLIMFLLGPLFLLLITHRLVRRKANRAERIGVYATNTAIVALAVAVSLLIGWQQYLIIQGLILYFGLMAGMWLFYVQHQFEDVYWSAGKEWDFVAASLDGSSYYALPKVLRWFTGSIGFHHIHHLNPRIPNYRLAKSHEALVAVRPVKQVSLLGSLKALRYRLFDERTGEMVGFRAAHRLIQQRTERVAG